MRRAIVVLLALMCVSPTLAWDFDQKQFNVVLSLTQHTGVEDRLSVNTNAQWTAVQEGDGAIDVKLKSRYEQELGGTTIRDMLELESTWVSPVKGRPPIAKIRTRGTHDFSDTFMLIAGGVRFDLDHQDYVEISAGVSKALQTGDDWAPDIGVEFLFRKQWDRLSLGIKPGANYAVEGRIRSADGDLRVIYDQTLRYKMSEHISLSWQFEYEDFRDKEETHSVFGVGYDW